MPSVVGVFSCFHGTTTTAKPLLLSDRYRHPGEPAEMESESSLRVEGGALRRHERNRGKHLKMWTPLLGLVLALDGSLVAAAASAGASHSCVLLEEGSVKCWRENYHGQLGQNDEVARGKDNSTMGDSLPEVPLGTFTAVAVESGGEFNCALSSDGAGKCWGRSEYGQLGLGDT